MSPVAVVSPTDRPDPWRTAASAAARRTGPAPGRIVLAVLVGIAGPLARLTRVGGQLDGAVVIVATAVGILVVALAVRHPASRLVLAGVVIGAGTAVARSSIGGVSILLLGAAIAVAVLAFGAWDRSASASVTAIPLLVTAQVTWVRTGRAVIAGALLVLAVVAVLLRRRWPHALDAFETRLGRGVERLARAAGALVVLIVALPVMYLPGAVLGAAERRRRRGWRLRADTVTDHRRDATFPFAAADRPVRRRRQLVGAVSLAVAGALAVAVVADRRSLPADRPALRATVVSGPRNPDDLRWKLYVPIEDRPATLGVDYGPQVLEDWLFMAFEPTPDGPSKYVLADSSGEYTNVTDGERRTIPPSCKCPRVTIWLMGGSAVFGLGQRDDHTIASELVRAGRQRGLALDVHNFGVPGWTLWDEYHAVTERLASGGTRPDLVVFVDGFNDALYSMIQTIVWGPRWDDPVVNEISEGGPSETFRDMSDEEATARLAQVGGPTEIGTRAGLRYAALRAEVQTRLGDEQVDSAFFVQPDAYASATQRDAVRFEASYDPVKIDPVAEVLDAFTAVVGEHSVDLRHLFDDESAPMFLDIAHNSERGAAVVADAIAASTEPDLVRLSTGNER